MFYRVIMNFLMELDELCGYLLKPTLLFLAIQLNIMLLKGIEVSYGVH